MSSESDLPSPPEAEAGAEKARADLVNTLSHLKENLKPANMVDEVMSSAKLNASEISNQVWDVARRNPLPAALIGAGVFLMLGLGARKGMSPSRTFGTRPAGVAAAEPEFRSHVVRPAAYATSRSPSGSVVGTARRAVSDAADRASHLVDAAGVQVSGVVSRGTASARDMYRNTARKGGSMATLSNPRNTLGSLTKLIEDQPLILAAFGLAVGAAIGAAVPQTETENSLMGEGSRSVKDAAQDLARDQYGQIKSAATQVVSDIKQTVADHGVNTDNLSGLVHDVAEKAKTATADAGRKLDPSAS